MTEQVPGIELFLSSEKAVQGAAKFRDAVESAAQAVERIGLVVDKLDGLLDRVGLAAKGAVAPLKRLGDSAAEIGAKLQQGGEQAQRFEARMGRLGGTLGGVARQFALLLGAAGAISGIGAAISAFADYEDKLRILGSIAGATGAQLQKLEDAAVNLSQNSRFTPREGIDGLTELSRAGLSAQDAITALKPTADLARVGLLGLSDSSAIVTKTLTQFALGADQASRVADVLAKAANSSNADVGTLADALAKTGPVARQFGVSLEDTVAALAKLADNGLAANIAGTGLQRVLIQLRSPTEEAQRALLGLGLTAEKINPEKVGLTGALRNLGAAGLSVQDSVSLVGTEFASLLTILTGSVGAIDQVGAALRDSTGEAAKQAAAGADTLAAAFADLRGASEQFAVSAGRGGIGQALTDITRTGAEVIRVLAGDKKAMEEAGAAAKLLATGLQLATVAGVAFAAAKVAGVIAGVANSLKAATAATVVYEAATGLAAARVGLATRAFAALTAVMRANPFIAVATAIAGVVTALTVFGGKSDEAVDNLESQRAYAKSLEEQYRSLAEAVGLVARGPGEFSNQSDAAQKLRQTRDEAQKLAAALELAGESGRAPIQAITAFAELDAGAARIKQLIDQLPELEKAAKQTAEEVRKITLNQLAVNEPNVSPRQGADRGAQRSQAIQAEQEAAKALAAQLKLIAEAENSLGIETDAAGQKVLKQVEGLEILRRILADAEDRAKKTGLALEKLGEGNQTDISSAVRALVAERERELELAKLTGAEREKAILIAEAEKRAGQGLNDAEKERLGTLAQSIVAGEALVQQRRREKQEAEKAAELQRELPQNLAELQKRYQDELAIAQETGLQRELIRAAVEAENDAKAIGLALDTEAFAQLKAQAEERARLAFEERQQKRESRVDRRQGEALRQLEQEEQLLRLSGAEREKYRLQIEAENEARQAGLVLGTAEYADYVKRKTAVGELARAQEQLAQLGSQFAGAWTNALEQFIIDGGRARDVARALFQDLQRLALRQTAGIGLNQLFTQGAQGLAGLFAGSGPTQNGLPVAPGSSLPDLNAQLGYNPLAPRLTGGMIPAMVGTVIDQPTILQRGGSAYSVAEGGKTTPEAIFRLARDERGNLGVAAVGGGGDTINMSFPGVRNATDAKAMRSTFGQQVRAIRAGDKRGRRGRRPAGE
jgi:TP901 family phage tail tape measure protein